MIKSLLLTATVDPKGTPSVYRHDPIQRLEDYKKAASAFAKTKGIDLIVFAENSGWPKSQLEALFESNCCLPSVKILECKPVADEIKAIGGKSIGDMSMMMQAMSCDSNLGQSDLVLKVSGRVVLSNIRQLLDLMRDPSVDIFANTRSHFTWAESVCFAAKPDFLRRYLFPLADQINEPDSCIEHVLARAIHKLAADGGTWRPLPCYPHLYGIRGGNGLPYNYGWLKERMRDLKHLIYKKMVGF